MSIKILFDLIYNFIQMKNTKQNRLMNILEMEKNFIKHK